jgi:hypothetical protein
MFSGGGGGGGAGPMSQASVSGTRATESRVDERRFYFGVSLFTRCPHFLRFEIAFRAVKTESICVLGSATLFSSK